MDTQYVRVKNGTITEGPEPLREYMPDHIRMGWLPTNITDGVICTDEYTIYDDRVDYILIDNKPSDEDILLIRKQERIFNIEQEYLRMLNVVGVDTGLGFNMKSTDGDARILQEAVSFLGSTEGGEETVMTLKDTNGKIHQDIELTDVQRVVNLIKRNYLTLWNDREVKKAKTLEADDLEELDSI